VAMGIWNFGKKFCSIALYSDVLPWILWFSIVGIVALFMAIVGLVRLQPWKLLSKRQVDTADDGQVETADDGVAEAEDVAYKKQDSCAMTITSWKLGCGLLWRDVKWLAFDIILRRHADENRSYRQNPAVQWDLGLHLALQLFIPLVSWTLLLACLFFWGHIFPTYWWMERHLDGLWGFALEDGFNYTAPVWMGEFGQNVRGQYWLNFVRYLSSRDVDFAYWALNGIKYAEGAIDGASGNFITYETPRWENETFGILSHDYATVRHPWLLLDLQALMSSPATWVPDEPPCNRHVLGGSCGAR